MSNPIQLSSAGVSVPKGHALHTAVDCILLKIREHYLCFAMDLTQWSPCGITKMVVDFGDKLLITASLLFSMKWY